MAGESSIEELLFRIKVDPTQLERLGPLVADELKEAAAAAQGFQVSDAAFQSMGAQMGAAVLRGLQGFLSGKGIDVSQLFTGDLAKAVDPGKVRQLQEQLQNAGARATQRAVSDPTGAQQEAQLNRLIQQRDKLARTEAPKAGQSVFASSNNGPRQKVGRDILDALGLGTLQPIVKGNGNFDQQAARQQLTELRSGGLTELERQIQELSNVLGRQAPARPTPPPPVVPAPTPAAGGAGGGQRPPTPPPAATPPPPSQPPRPTPPPTFNPPTQSSPGAPIKGGATSGLNPAEVEQVLRNIGSPPLANGGQALLELLGSTNRVKDATGGLAGTAAEEARYQFTSANGRGGDYAALASQVTSEALSRQENAAAARRQVSGLVDSKGNPIEAAVQQDTLRQAQATEAARQRAQAAQAARENLGLVDNKGLPFQSDVVQRALESVRAAENGALARTAQQTAAGSFDSRVGPNGLFDPAAVQRDADNAARARDNSRVQTNARIEASSFDPRLAELQGQAQAGSSQIASVRSIADSLARQGQTASSIAAIDAELPYAYARLEQAELSRARSLVEQAARARVNPLANSTQVDIAEGKLRNAQDAGADARVRGDYIRNGRNVQTYTDPVLQTAADRLNERTQAEQGRRQGVQSTGLTEPQVRFDNAEYSGRQQALDNLARAQVQLLDQEIAVATRSGQLEKAKLDARLRLAEADARGLVTTPSGQAAVQSLTDEERRRGAANVQKQEREVANRNRAEDLRTYLDNPAVSRVDKAVALARNATPGTPANEQRTVGQRFREGFLGDRQDPIETLGQTLKFSTFYGGAYLVLNQVQQAFTKAIGGALQYEDALRALNATTQNSSEENEKLAEAVTRVGEATGTGTAASAATLQKTLGLYDLTQADADTQQTVAVPAVAVAQRLARLDGSDPQVAATQLAGVIRSFGLGDQSQSYVEDVATVIGKRSGTSAADLLTGTTQIGTLASAAGFDLPQTLALISRLTSTTGRSATDVAGNLSQVFSKADDPAATAKLAQYGVDTQGTTLAQQIAQLSGMGLDDKTLNQIAQSFGRGLSGAAFLNIVKNQDSITSLADDGANAAPGSGAKYFNDVFGKSITEQLNKLGIEFQNLVNTLVKAGLLNFLGLVIGGARAVIGAVNDVVSVFNLIPSPLRQVIVGIGELYLALRLLGALKVAGVVTSIAQSAAASRAGGILSSLSGGASAAGAVGAGAALRAGGSAAKGLAGRGLGAVFGTALGRASIVGGVAYGVYDAARETNDLNTTAKQASNVAAGANDASSYRAAADAQRAVVTASLDQQAFSFAHLSTLELAPLINRLGFSNSAKQQDAARTNQSYLNSVADQLDAAQAKANAADPANTFGQFASADQVSNAMAQLTARGFTATQAIESLNKAFGTLVYRAQAGTAGVAAYLGAGTSPAFAASVAGTSDDAIKAAVDAARKSAADQTAAANDLPGRTVYQRGPVLGATKQTNAANVLDGVGTVANEAVNKAVADTLAGFGIDADSGSATLTQEQLGIVQTNALNALKASIPNYASLPENVRKAFEDAYVKALPDAIASYTTGNPVTGDQALASAAAAISGAATVKDQVGGLNRDESLGTSTALSALQTQRQTLADALNNAVANGATGDDLAKFRLALQQTDIVINTYIEDQITQREAKIDAALSLQQSRLGVNNTVGRSQANIAAITKKLSYNDLTSTERDALTTQLNDANAQLPYQQAAAAAANVTGDLSAGNQSAQLQAQLEAVQAQKALDAPKKIASTTLVQNAAAKARAAALGALGLGAAALAQNLATGDAKYVTSYTTEPESEAFGNDKTQEQQIKQQQRQLKLQTDYDKALKEAGRNKQQALAAATTDADARVKDAQTYGDADDVAKAQLALINATDAEVQYSLDLAYALAKNAHPHDQIALLQDAVDDANKRLADAQASGDPKAIADAQAAQETARYNQDKYAVDIASAQNNLSVAPDDRLGQARVAVENAQSLLNFYISKNQQNTVEFVQAQIALQQAMYDAAKAQEEVIGKTARRTGVDLTDPIVSARVALEDLVAQQNAASTPEEKAALQPDIDQAKSSVAISEIDRKTSDIRDAHDLKQTTDAEYINQLQSEYDTVQAQLAAMDKNATGYEALRQKGIEIAKLLNSAAEDLNSEFNLNGVALPSVYEVRRAVGASASEIRSQVVDYSSTQAGTVIINGADMTQVFAYINQTLGTGSTAVYTTSPRRTV